MRNRLRSPLVIAWLLTACAAPQVDERPRAPSPPPATSASASASAEPAKPAVAEAKELASDEKVTVAEGVTVEAAKGWWSRPIEGGLVLEDPERKLAIATLVVEGAADPASAIRAAWPRFQPKGTRTEKELVTPPTRDGWDAIAQQTYDVPPAEGRVVLALARRKGQTYYVSLVDGAVTTFQKRGAQATTLLTSVKAPGLDAERFATDARRPLTPERLEAIAAFVEEARAALEVPGAAIAIVEGGKVVFQRGFGVKELGKKAPVKPETRFLIGSTTKSLTTLLQARLVADGRARWDTPVTELLPEFALADANLTRAVTLRHTACACTGMPRRDLGMLLEADSATPASRVAEMKTWSPTTGFGETFQYSNHLVAVGGFAAARALDRKGELGAAYDRAMQSEVFGPLGMTKTTFDRKRAAQGDVAGPHGLAYAAPPRALANAEERFVETMRPAGGAWSTVGDLAKYLQLELAGGKFEGKQLVPAEVLAERRKPGIKITDTMSYGLGMFVEQMGGVTVVGHAGNTLGYSSDLWFLPEHGVGVALLYNVQGTSTFRDLLKRRTLEELFGAKPRAKELLAYVVADEKKDREKDAARIATPSPELSARVAGRYRSDAVGGLAVTGAGDALTVDFGEYRSRVGARRESDGSDTLLTLDPPLAGLPLLVDGEGAARTLTLPGDQTRYVFKPEADASAAKAPAAK